MADKLTTEELDFLEDFATDILHLVGNDVEPRKLINMINEIRTWRKAGNVFIEIVDTIENRCMAAETSTSQEMTNEEFGAIYKQIHAAMQG